MIFSLTISFWKGVGGGGGDQFIFFLFPICISSKKLKESM